MISHSKLLPSYVKPFKLVTNTTIGRWVKSFLQDSGIDIHFSAHSSITVSSSYGFLSGLPLNDVLKAGGWTNAGTFAKHDLYILYSKYVNKKEQNFVYQTLIRLLSPSLLETCGSSQV